MLIKKDIVFHRGDAAPFFLSYPGNLTGHDLSFVVKPDRELTSARLIEIFSTDINFNINYDAEKLKSLIAITPIENDTNNLSHASYVYDIFDSTDKITLFDGNFYLTSDVQTPYDNTDLPAGAVRYVAVPLSHGTYEEMLAIINPVPGQPFTVDSGVNNNTIYHWNVVESRWTASKQYNNKQLLVHDDFNRDDTESGELETTPTGQDWDLYSVPPGYGRIEDCRFRSDSGITVYAKIELPVVPTLIGARVSFVEGNDPEGSASIATLAICRDVVDFDKHIAVHVNVSLGGWTLMVRDDGGFDTIEGGVFTTPLSMDGTIYPIEISVNGNTVTMNICGFLHTAYNERISPLMGKLAFWEVSSNNNPLYRDLVRFDEIWAGSSPVGSQIGNILNDISGGISVKSISVNEAVLEENDRLAVKGNLTITEGGSLFTPGVGGVGNVYTNNLRFKNKAYTGYIAFADRNISGSEATYDLSNVSSISYKIISAALTDGAPTAAEINTATGLTPSTAGAGWSVYIKDSNGSGLMYKIISDGTNWFYFAGAIAS